MPKMPVKEKKEMPFTAHRRHQYWSADIRYFDDHKLGGRAYVVSVLDSLGYTRFRHWRIYGEEALAGREAALWLAL